MKREKILNWMVTSISQASSAFNLLMNAIFNCIILKYLNFATFSKDVFDIIKL